MIGVPADGGREPQDVLAAEQALDRAAHDRGAQRPGAIGPVAVAQVDGRAPVSAQARRSSSARMRAASRPLAKPERASHSLTGSSPGGGPAQTVTTVARSPSPLQHVREREHGVVEVGRDDELPGSAGDKAAIVCVRSRSVKICVVGGGSTYTPELVDGILRRSARLPASELVLLDPNHERLEIVGRFARRMCEASGSNLQVRWTADAADALAGSAFVVTQLRVGGQEARHRDELAGRDFGLIGQETTGIGGFAKALRTIPVMLEIAREVERSAPGATLVNFTNPAGLDHGASAAPCLAARRGPLQRALEHADRGRGCARLRLRRDRDRLRRPQPPLVGARFPGAAGRSARPRCWRAIASCSSTGAPDDPGFAPETISLLGAVPNYYDLYYYETAAMLRHRSRCRRAPRR